MTLVSIVVPCYNQAQYLDESLQSIADQTYTHWECIIVNDGSPDNTEAVARKWEAKDARFIYLHKENGGVSSARNVGIEKGNGEFILTLDADDKYDPTFLEKALNKLLANTELGIVSSWGQYFTNDKQFQVFKSNAKTVTDFLFYNGINMGSSLFRKVCWKQVGGYDTNPRNGYEDWEFYLRVCALGWRVQVIEEVLFFYRQHQVSRRKEMNVKGNENKKYIFIKNKDIYFDHFEIFVNRYLQNCDKENAENNKYANTIDYKLGSAILKPLRDIKWFFINLFK